MNSIVIQPFSISGSCGIRGNLFWETEWKNSDLSFPVSTSDELKGKTLSGLHSSPAAHAVFLSAWIIHTERASFPREEEKCSERLGPARVAGLFTARTLTWAPALYVWMEITSPWLSEHRKELSHRVQIWGHFSEIRNTSVHNSFTKH